MYMECCLVICVIHEVGKYSARIIEMIYCNKHLDCNSTYTYSSENRIQEPFILYRHTGN
jgi:hypothetical protein